MVLATGSVLTEKITSRSHKLETKRRRVLLRNISEPSTSAGFRSSTTTTMGALLNEVKRSDVIGFWKVTNENGLRLELHDDCHVIPKYTLIVNSGLTFTLFVYGWAIPDDHTFYRARSRSVRPDNILELSRVIESSGNV